jgi:hypothetical protein
MQQAVYTANTTRQPDCRHHLLVLLAAQLSLAVGDVDVQLHGNTQGREQSG